MKHHPHTTRLQEAAKQVLLMISEFVGINSLYVATNDRKVNYIVEAFNRDYILVNRSQTLPFEDVY